MVTVVLMPPPLPSAAVAVASTGPAAPAAPAQAPVSAARALLDQGDRAFGAKDYSQAKQLYETAVRQSTDAGERSYAYEVSVGLRHPTAAALPFEPLVKEETLTFHHRGRRQKLLERRGPAVTACNESGRRVEIGAELLASETALGSLQDPTGFPDLHLVRRTMRDWRFYHEMRTDAGSALRRPCLAVTSPSLASDGSNLAAVFATLVHIREDSAELDRAIEEAFPGARLVVPVPGRDAGFGMIFPDYPKRVFEAAELSDGTLRYLALTGALLAYRLPAFIALNEPETSLHPDLLDPLARLIARSAERSQIWLVTHSQILAAALAEHGAIAPRIVIKRDGETWMEGLRLLGDFAEPDEESGDG